ncbi:MAG: DUF4505 family protein [Leptospiraceae bacterium]|nr:DUF4505 family protein [Leptospiraceae bacterium]MCP5495103.1 DUF4505 family protein [Leptospiraceae bacterium]
MREYFYYIDFQGKLFHDNTELTDNQFLDFFFRRIIKNETDLHQDYPYMSPCGKEMNFIKVADIPFVFFKLNDNLLFYAPTLFVEFQPDQLSYSESGILYHPLNNVSIGRLHTKLLLEISPYIEMQNEKYILSWKGNRFLLKLKT